MADNYAYVCGMLKAAIEIAIYDLDHISNVSKYLAEVLERANAKLDEQDKPHTPDRTGYQPQR